MAQRLWIIALSILATATPPAAAATSIVGTWAESSTACSIPDQQLVIAPLAISGVFTCSFNNVRRTGDVVTWNGHCFSPDGSRRPEAGDMPAAMTATLSDGTLILSGSGLAVGPLTRCR
jgi:hypothetical protein